LDSKLKGLEHNTSVAVIAKICEIDEMRVKEVGTDGNTPLHWSLYFECEEDVVM